MKYIKNIRFWLIFLPLFYTMIGFVVVPWMITSQAPQWLKDRLNLDISVQSATFNPFSFELTLGNLKLFDATHKQLFGVKHLYLNYEPSHLFQKELLIQSIQIEEPHAVLQILQDGKLNIASLFPPSDTPENETHQNTTLPINFLIEQTIIHNGHILFEDLSTQKPFSLPIGPINYTINNFGFNKDDLSIHALEMALKNEEKITLASSLSLNPIKLHGELTLSAIALQDFWPYLMPQSKAILTQGLLSMRLPFWIDLSQKIPTIAIDKAALTLNNVQFVDEKQHNVIVVPKLSLDALSFAWPQATGEIDNLSLDEPFIDVAFEHGYIPTFISLLSPTSEAKNRSKETTSSTNSLGTITLHSFKINNGEMVLIDKNYKNTIPSKLTKLALEAKNISTDHNQTLSYTLSSVMDTNSSLSLKGTYLPKDDALQSTFEIKTFAIPKVQPYLASITPLKINHGFLSLNGTIKASFAKETPTIAFAADSIAIAQLLIQDTTKETFVAWEKLALQAIHYASLPASLHVEGITLMKPYINLDIHKDHTTNFTNIITTPSTPKHKKTTPMEFYIGKVTLKDGHANFKDATLPILFATYMNKLNGTISALNTKNTKPSTLTLEGKVGQYGYTKVEGALLPFDFKNHANLKVLFKNIDMPSLTPYSGKFLGYAIEKGKLSMDLSYTIKKGIMEGANKINIDSLTLGKKIESDDATSLPLDLAIALLKDSNGQIDIDMPVSGDLNNPDFKYGSVVWRAFGNLIGGIIASPFKLLGSIIGLSQSEGLKSIDFPAGSASFVSSEEEKMEQYRQILEKKVGLKLIIAPSYNEEIDTIALKNNELSRLIESITSKDDKEKNSYSKAIKTLFIQKYNEKIYDQLMQTYTEEKRSKSAINEALKEKILSTIILPKDTLTILANQRAQSFVSLLTTKYHINPARVKIGELKQTNALRDAWVGCEISIATN
ncbi:MAG: DUF748 domain-containing protein [Sulfurospirillaceae bacterium]|nr:DUF748 domain-containing protein [Sulfurospirillaceae bacterium]